MLTKVSSAFWKAALSAANQKGLGATRLRTEARLAETLKAADLWR